MTLWSTPVVSVFSHDFTTNHGVLEGVTMHTGSDGYDLIGDGMIRVPVNAANVDQIQRNRIIVAVTSTTAGTATIYPAFFIVKNKQAVVSDGMTQWEVTGPGLLEELNRRSIGDNVIAGLVEATLASTVTPADVATTLANTASGGATSIVVSSATSFAVGQTIEIELDTGDRHNSRISSVAGTTIGIENSLPSGATAGNDVTTNTGFILSVTVTAGAFELGHPAHITLDDGTIHAGTIAAYTPGSPGTLRILEGLPSVATSGNAVFQYTAVGVDAVTELMTNYAPADWSPTITAASTEAMVFGAKETVFEALLQIGQQVRGHFRYVPDPQRPAVLEWLDTPDTMDIVSFRMPNAAELPTMTADNGIIESIRQDISEQAAQVTRIYPQGAMGLGITRAENFVTPNPNFTPNFAEGYIVNTAAESGGAPRVDKHVPFEHIQATGNTEGELTQASIMLYNAAEQWLEDREEADPVFYEVTVQVQKPLKPYTTVHVAYSEDGLIINDTLIIQGFTYEMGQDNILRAHVRLSNIEAFRQETGDNFLASHVRRTDNALRHMGGAFGSAQSSILASVPVSRQVIAGIGLGGGGSLLHDVTVYLNTPGTVSLSSTNLAGPNHTHEFDETGLLTASVTITGAGALGGGGDLTANRTITMNTPASVTATSVNSSAVANHTHAADSTLARSNITITGTAALGGGGDLTANRTITMNTPGTITPTSVNSSAVANHTHAATGFAASADLHAAVTIGVGGLSAKLSITGGQVLTLASIAYSDLTGLPDLSSLHARQHVITSAADHTVTGAALDVIGLSATNTLAVLTPSANPGANPRILRTDASGYVQVLRLGAGIAPTVSLHASSSGNATALQVEAASLTTSPAVSIENMPLSTDTNSGRAIQIKATGESFGRLMLFSDGKIGTGPGSGNRDTYLSRAAANTWLISSDGSTGQGNLQVNDNAWIGLGSAAGRFIFDNLADDIIYIRDANLYFNDGTADRLMIRRGGDSSNVEADIRAHSALGLAGEVEVVCFIDCNNDTSTAYFGVAKDAENIAAATELFRVTEAGFMGLMDTTNADMTVGLTINQGANDNHILALKSSDVAHGMTTLVETDTYSFHRKFDGATGGLDMWGLSEDTTGIRFVGVATNGDTTKSTAAVAPIRLQANKKSGTSVGVMGTDENLVVVSDSGGAKFIVDKEGDIHYDGTGNIYDEYDDIALVRLIERETAVSGLVESRFDSYITANRSQLEQAGIVTFNADGRHFINMTKLQRLQSGALWQLHERLAHLEEKYNA